MNTGKGWYNVGRRNVAFLFCGCLLLASCASTPVVTDAIGEPLTDAIITGTELTGTAENIAGLVETLPASPVKESLVVESSKLTGQVEKLNRELALTRAGYYATIEDVGRLEADRDKWKDKAANRLIFAIILAAILALFVLYGILRR